MSSAADPEADYYAYSKTILGKSISDAHSGAMAKYTQDALVGSDPAFTHALENSSKHGLPVIAVAPAQGKFLSLLATMSRAKNILEVGTLGGYSAMWFAQAVKARGGKVTSIEIDPARHAVAVQNLEHAGVKMPSETEILLGAALDVLPKLEREIQAGTREKFDFVFIDADWENQWAYFDWGVKLCNGPGSVVYVDNVVRMLLEIGAVGHEKKDLSVENVVEKVGADHRVQAVVMETVGDKNYDGFLLAVVQ